MRSSHDKEKQMMIAAAHIDCGAINERCCFAGMIIIDKGERVWFFVTANI